MKTTITKGHKRLTAEVGAWIFNGETFSKVAFIPQSADESEWRDATDTEKEQWEKEHPIEPMDEQ